MSKVGQTRLYHTSLQFTFIVTYNCHVPILPLTVFHFLYKSRFRILCYFCIEIIPPFLFFFFFEMSHFNLTNCQFRQLQCPRSHFQWCTTVKAGLKQISWLHFKDLPLDYRIADETLVLLRDTHLPPNTSAFFYFYSNFLWVIWIQRLIFYGSSWINYPVEFSCCQYQYFCKMIV